MTAVKGIKERNKVTPFTDEAARALGTDLRTCRQKRD